MIPLRCRIPPAAAISAPGPADWERIPAMRCAIAQRLRSGGQGSGNDKPAGPSRATGSRAVRKTPATARLVARSRCACKTAGSFRSAIPTAHGEVAGRLRSASQPTRHIVQSQIGTGQGKAAACRFRRLPRQPGGLHQRLPDSSPRQKKRANCCIRIALRNQPPASAPESGPIRGESE